MFYLIINLKNNFKERLMLNVLLVKLEPIYYRGSNIVGLAEDNYYD